MGYDGGFMKRTFKGHCYERVDIDLPTLDQDVIQLVGFKNIDVPLYPYEYTELTKEMFEQYIKDMREHIENLSLKYLLSNYGKDAIDYFENILKEIDELEKYIPKDRFETIIFYWDR